jgi:hypothetical protein
MAPAKLGIIISASIVLVILAIVAAILIPGLLPGSIGAPTDATTAPGVLEPITLSADPAQLVDMPAPGSGSGAEALYAEMVKTAIGTGDWHNFQDFYDKVNKTAKPQDDPQFASILEKLLAAATKAVPTDDLIFDQLRITPLSDYNGSRGILYGIGKMAGKAAREYRDSGDKAKARKVYEAAYIFGYRLWQFGPYAAYRKGGLDVMSEGSAGLASLLEDMHDPKASLAKEMTQAIDEAGMKWQDKTKIVFSVAPIPGDLANLALNDKDRAWRIEGVMWLGVAKWTTVAGKERAAVDKFLLDQARTSDKVYADTAAKAAAFTDDDKNQIPTKLD